MKGYMYVDMCIIKRSLVTTHFQSNIRTVSRSSLVLQLLYTPNTVSRLCFPFGFINIQIVQMPYNHAGEFLAFGFVPSSALLASPFLRQLGCLE